MVPVVSVELPAEVAEEVVGRERSVWSPLEVAAAGALSGCEAVQGWRSLAQRPPGSST